MKITETFFSFLVAVFFLQSLSVASKTQTYFENVFVRNLTLKECRKAQWVMNFLDVAIPFPTKIRVSILSFRSQFQVLYLYKILHFKNHCYCFLRYNLDRPVMPENALSSEKTRSSDFYLEIFNGLISPFKKSPIESFQLVENFELNECQFCSLCQNTDNPKTLKKLMSMIHFGNPSHIFPLLQVWFPPQR